MKDKTYLYFFVVYFKQELLRPPYLFGRYLSCSTKALDIARDLSELIFSGDDDFDGKMFVFRSEDISYIEIFPLDDEFEKDNFKDNEHVISYLKKVDMVRVNEGKSYGKKSKQSNTISK
jgi:hypothetical protein